MAELASKIFRASVGFVGIFGNGLVCVTITKVRFMHTITNAFIFNQALIDLIGSLMSFLRSAVPIPDPVPAGALGKILCSLWVSDYVVWGPFTASTFNLVCLTLERYLAIVFPFRYQVLATPRNVMATILGIWVSGFLFASYGIYLRYYEAGECVLNPVAHPEVLGVAVFFVMYFLPVIVMLLVYVHITLVLKKGAGRVEPRQAARASTDGVNPEGQGESLMRARRNTFKTLLIVSVAYVICWTPNEIFFFLFNLGVQVDFSSPLFYISIGMVAMNCCLNPIIYAIKYKQFRKALAVLFGKGGGESSLAPVSTGEG